MYIVSEDLASQSYGSQRMTDISVFVLAGRDIKKEEKEKER